MANQEEIKMQQEEIIKEEQTSEEQQPKTMTDKLIALRQEWTKEVEDMNDNMKNLAQVDHLMNVIYTKRQKAVDLYYGTLGVFNKQVRQYKQQYAVLFNNFKTGQQNGIRYSSDSSIDRQIEAQLIERKEIIDELKNFTDFMWETIKTIDGVQYAINSKIKIYELMNGVKF